MPHIQIVDLVSTIQLPELGIKTQESIQCMCGACVRAIQRGGFGPLSFQLSIRSRSYDPYEHMRIEFRFIQCYSNTYFRCK